MFNEKKLEVNAERTIVRCELELLNHETFPAFVSKTGKKIGNGLNPELSACSLPNSIADNWFVDSLRSSGAVTNSLPIH